jgi:hypothetical protein
VREHHDCLDSPFVPEFPFIAFGGIRNRTNEFNAELLIYPVTLSHIFRENKEKHMLSEDAMNIDLAGRWIPCRREGIVKDACGVYGNESTVFRDKIQLLNLDTLYFFAFCDDNYECVSYTR